MKINMTAAGAPLLGPEPEEPVIITEVGSYDAGKGALIMLEDENLLFKVAYNGSHIVLGLPIDELLDIITEWNHQQHEFKES